MKLRLEELSANLQQRLAPIYILSGDEPLLLQEAADQIRAALRKGGYDERTVLTAGAGFRWSELNEEGVELSLFAERKIVDLRLPTGKPGRDGGKILTEWCENPPPDKVLLIISAKLDGSSQKSKWYKSIERAGVAIPIWQIDPQHLPRWIVQRMRVMGMQISSQAALLLADRVEGNLLAAVQEMEKLKLLNTPDENGGEIVVDEKMVLKMVADSARFDVFKLSDAVMVGDKQRALRVLQGLKEEGVAVQIVLWALLRDLRELAAMSLESNPRAYKPLEFSPMWTKRVGIFSSALNRLGVDRIAGLVRRLGLIDRAGKGVIEGDPWRGVEDFIVRA
ncbi:MAG: DNA polymerase III subunit delta [Thiotrichales bacterium]|nr:DNA polymerase III subunit delta [Thiotrichales bacterium]MBT3613132.1 DNA polymerase III subunit delta [Thiotrichales bacterium]MBT3752806.1 DNA polymerase III subunit delta [Thiotrichales bacterium]MBT3837988.1 DNA polymerase III subunit delta [Thiotrichales bacterium]MBT4152191.1 DNA polymerase III subunit delta [Thiotrichales bacterium]